MFPEAPQDQVMLALAMLDLDAEDHRRIFKTEMRQANTPSAWRKVHSRLDRARAVFRDLN